MTCFRPSQAASIALIMLLAGASHGNALTKEQAIENCRNSVGRPIVQACVRAGGGSIEACREQARPKVRACVMAALNAANGRANVAMPVPKELAEPPLDAAIATPVAFVAPPRPIADITAIIVNENPDPGKN